MSSAPPRADRGGRITEFLDRAGWSGSTRTDLAADASFRRYERIARGTETAVLMDAPPPREDVRPFAAIARILRGLDLSAPRVLAEDHETGLLLLEDFGDATYTRVLESEGNARARELYTLAVDLLIELHRRFATADPEADVPDYDDDRLLQEALLFVDWYFPAITGAAVPIAHVDAFRALWVDLFPLARQVPRSLVLRDYHVDNLMLLHGRRGLSACGLLDFQDAVIGPVSYDLVSLLEDARRDVDPALATEMMERYLAAFPRIDAEAFSASYALLGAQRNAKIIGIFTRLHRRDGKPSYLKNIPRVWRLLEDDLAHPALRGMRAWFDEVVPRERRLVPETGREA